MDWLSKGGMSARFIKPVYDGDRVKVVAKRTGKGGGEFEIQVLNAEGTLCAVGSAGIPSDKLEAPRAADYPRRPLPETGKRTEARAASLPVGMPLGTWDFFLEVDGAERKARDEYLDDLSIYAGSDAIYHPGYLLRQGNWILMNNVALGPWVHTRSEVRNFASPKAGEKLSMRGFVAGAYEKKGHEMADFDLAIFDSQDRCIMKVLHTAIIRIKPAR